MVSNDKDYLFLKCEDHERFDKMPKQTKQERIEIYEDQYDVNFSNADLLHEALNEISDVQVKYLAISSNPSFVRAIFSNFIHKVTANQLKFDREGNDI